MNIFKQLKFAYQLQRARSEYDWATRRRVPIWLACIRAFRLVILKQAVYLTYPVNGKKSS